MGLLDSLLGGALGNMLGGAAGGGQPQGQGGQPQGQGGQSVLLRIALQLLQQSGGLAGILAKLRQAGFGKQADSWVSTGPNLPLSGAQVSQALGTDTLDQLAGQVGMDAGQLSQGLAQMLPEVVNQMTPKGEVPPNDQDLISGSLQDLLKRGLGS